MLILNGLFAQPYKRDKLLRFDNSQFKKKKGFRISVKNTDACIGKGDSHSV